MIKVVFIILAIIACGLSIYAAVRRSKDYKRTSLFFQMNGEGREDNLGKMTPSALEGLEEAEQRKKEQK